MKTYVLEVLHGGSPVRGTCVTNGALQEDEARTSIVGEHLIHQFKNKGYEKGIASAGHY